MIMGNAEDAAQTPSADEQTPAAQPAPEPDPAAQPAPEPDPAAQVIPPEPDDTGGVAQPDSKYEI
jgi:hypothetical protein